MSEFINGLAISSMIFFNIFCFLGIIAFAYMIKAFASMKRKTDETFGMAQEVLYNVNESVENVNQSGFLNEVLGFIFGIFGNKRSKRGSFFDRR